MFNLLCLFFLFFSFSEIFTDSRGEEKRIEQEEKKDVSETAPCMPPKISYLVTNYGNPGDTIRIKGRRFGLKPGKVTFNGVPAEILVWRTETIYVKVPEKAKTGPVIVNNGCDNSNAVIFTVGPPPQGLQRGTIW